jgi:hypothetical protein
LNPKESQQFIQTNPSAIEGKTSLRYRSFRLLHSSVCVVGNRTFERNLFSWRVRENNKPIAKLRRLAWQTWAYQFETEPLLQVRNRLFGSPVFESGNWSGELIEYWVGSGRKVSCGDFVFWYRKEGELDFTINDPAWMLRLVTISFFALDLTNDDC